MAFHRYSIETDQPLGPLWEFVREMDHWAPLVTGYQRHEKRSETESVWTLKGDVGVLSRTVTFDVRITEWAGPERVAFELAGVNEPMKGEGAFRLEAAGPPGSGAARPEATAPARARGLAGLWERLVRFLFRRFRGAPPATPAQPATTVRTRMTFELRIDPGGPMAPMIDAMMKPAMAAAAEDLAQRIVARLEGQRADTTPREESR